jgi:hypothetical protein
VPASQLAVHIAEIVGAGWIATGLIAFSIYRFRRRHSATDVIEIVIQLVGGAILGAIALAGVLEGDS